jgi:hypothetical protein
MEGLDRLNVWKAAKDLTVKIYRQVISILPVEEKYGLTLQIRRAAAPIHHEPVAIHRLPKVLICKHL